MSARVSGALTRCSHLLRAALRRRLPARLGRFALGALVTTTVVGLVLAIPVMSGVGAPAVQLDSSSTTSPTREGSSPVVMGMDGRPVSSADFAGTTTSNAPPSSPAPTSSPESAVAAAPEPTDEVVGSLEAPAPGTTAAPPAETTSTGGTTSGSPSPPAPGQPTPFTPGPAPAPTASTESPSESSSESPSDSPDPAADVLALLNAERAAAGCGALVTDAGLAATAAAHSAAMSGTGVLGLDGLVGAVAQGTDATSVVDGWFADSAGDPLLDCSWTSVGVAVVDGWWTALVA